MNTADPPERQHADREGKRCLQAELPALAQSAVFQRIGGGRSRLIGLGRFKHGEACTVRPPRATRRGQPGQARDEQGPGRKPGSPPCPTHRELRPGRSQLDRHRTRSACPRLQRVFRRRHVITSGLYSGDNIRGLDLRIGVDGERLVRQIDRALDNAVNVRDGLLDPADTGDAVQAASGRVNERSVATVTTLHRSRGRAAAPRRRSSWRPRAGWPRRPRPRVVGDPSL